MAETVQLIEELSLREQFNRDAFGHRIGQVSRMLRTVSGQRDSRTVEDVRMVNVNIAALQQPSIGVRLGRTEFVGVEGRWREDLVAGTKVFTGGLESSDRGAMMLVQTSAGVVGTFSDPEGRVFEIQPVDVRNTDKRHVIRQMANLGEGECVVRVSTAGELANQGGLAESQEVNAYGVRDIRTIDKLVLWTPQAFNAFNGSILERVRVGVARTNEAMMFSGFEGRFHLAHAQLIDGLPDGAESHRVLDALIASEAVRRLRDQFRADKVQLVVSKFSDGGGGIGELNGDFSVVNNIDSMAHEDGHTVGLHHQRRNSGGGSPVTGEGWGFENPAEGVCCMMSYRTGPNGEVMTRLARFSNRQRGFGSFESHSPGTFSVTYERAANRYVPTSAPRRARHVVFLPMVGN